MATKYIQQHFAEQEDTFTEEFNQFQEGVSSKFTAQERELIFLRSQIANLNAGSDTSIQKVLRLVLWNADTNTEIRELVRNSVIDLNVDKGNLNIKAITGAGGVESNVGSVVFFLGGKVTREEIQNSAPYFAFGDASSIPNPHKFEVGNYTLQAIPYSETNAGGEIGASKYVNVSVVKPAVPGQILGCMDPAATNYNPNATAPDPNNPCTYAPPTPYVRQESLITAQSNNDSGVIGTPFKLENAASYGIQVVSTQSRFPGGKAIKFEMRKVSDPAGVIRAELKINERTRLDRTMTYGYSRYIPDNGDFVDDDNYRIMGQLHRWPDNEPGRVDGKAPPPISFYETAGRTYLKINSSAKPANTLPDYTKRYDLGPTIKGRWVDWVIKIYSAYDDTGILDVYWSMPNAQGKMELRQVVKHRGPTTFNDLYLPNYPKWGIYCYDWNQQNKAVVLYDELRAVKGTSGTLKDAMPDPNLPIVQML